MAYVVAHEDTLEALEQAAKRVGYEVVKALSALPVSQRMARAVSILKPPPGDAALPDVLGEEAAWGILAGVSSQLWAEIRVIINHESYHPIKAPGISTESGLQIWCYLDAVDGTVKLAGLGNEPGRLRSANDGAWAVGLAFTEPTSKALEELLLSDFKVSAVTDGSVCEASSSRNPPFPRMAIATGVEVQGNNHGNHSYVTREGVGAPAYNSPCTITLHTSTNQRLSQSFVFLDAFQTRTPGDESLAGALYARLMNRNEGGAFDVLRSYGNLSAIVRNMLGWRCPPGTPHGASIDGTWLEAQCSGFLVVNENLHNLIPAVPIILGAGGIATDFEGVPLLNRRLSAGRCSVLYASNERIHKDLLLLIMKIRRSQEVENIPQDMTTTRKS
ncbi:hypothetical protein CEUSTIGMA_g7638.t1 [Chlamydomonas eustigma]|uniref:Uncharacterized protein n=1 Tax=Chlamydomonas eustigma TaxID=1157962 RepID=A0A250XBR3_9CHLO|nr:hypothetical protein CEUSTIGMA_g7638.t1 [Chlamydomonas eustigma]|eukprot:GAX80200.1 hypothetical protein CEUSTIGMA_g7638.t1 [Chlamydomonas eustigma]